MDKLFNNHIDNIIVTIIFITLVYFEITIQLGGNYLIFHIEV